tara:strand:+ start:1949 stop:2524 length:576 start_codon:yes stop_codon:yes gene_type:complete
MKHIIKEWRKFICEARGFGEGEPPNKKGWYKKQTIVVEEDNLEQNTYSFDFDNTLIRYKTLEDGDVEYLGPHDEYVNILRKLADDGHRVVIVTSRTQLKQKFPWDDAPTPEELVADLNLPVEIIEYTSGDLKTKKLLDLGVSHHWDDDQEEVDSAIEAGIGATKVPVPGEETQQLRDKWLAHMAKDEEETN